MKKMKVSWEPIAPGAMSETEVFSLHEGLQVLERVSNGKLLVLQEDGAWEEWEDGKGNDATFYLATRQY